MDWCQHKAHLIWLPVLLCLAVCASGFNNKRVLLRDVQVLTLKSSARTTGRRSAPIAQLKCVGGAAQNEDRPLSAQCYNRGFDGRDVQWECKADLDGSVKFGDIEVVCEGYDHPDDPYILAGSCGMEYMLEYTKEGQANQGGGGYYNSYSNYGSGKKGGSSTFGSIVQIAVVAGFVYVIYKNCIHASTVDDGSGGTGGGPGGGWGGGGGGGGGWGGGGGAPPPPGWRPSGAPPPYSEKDTYTNSAPPRGAAGGAAAGNGPGGAGFWTGMAGGGLLGYLMGGNRGYGGGYGGGYQQRRPYGGGYGQGFGGGGGGGFFGGGGGGVGGTGPSTSGTRSASGFGGTRRR